ncbi:MAG: hypothetical protein J2P21_21540 [Chloracidobacterium sp.]|nr:hypothetical protein [Chloracidobacterium sp.]
MREKFLIAILITGAAYQMLPGASVQDAGAKAQQLTREARSALGIEKLKSLSVKGDYRRKIGQLEMSGEISYDILLPDKLMKTETMAPMPGIEITQIEALNGDGVWQDQQRHGGGGGMIMIRRSPGPSADPAKAQDMMRQIVRSDFARLLIGWLMTSPPSFPLEFSFAGEAESPDGKADVLDVKGPDKFAMRLFLDQKTHYPLMLTYTGKKPRLMTQTAPPGKSPGNPEEMEKRMKDMDAEAAQQPDVEFRIYLSDYRQVDGVLFPHKLSRAIEDEVSEEIEIKNVKVNPQIKPEKFVKK